MGVREDYQRALKLAKQGKYIDARQLLTQHNHPKTDELLKHINKAILEERASPKTTKPKKKTPTQSPLKNIFAAIGISFLVVCGGFFILGLVTSLPSGSQSTITSDTDVPTATNAPITLTLEAIPVTPLSPQTVNAAIAPQTRECPYDGCAPILVYQSEELELLGIVDGVLLEGSTLWYQVARGDEILFIHEHSIYFDGPTPIVPTTDWRLEVQPVYYGDSNSSSSSSNSSQNQWSCTIDYDCDDFNSCSQVRSYLNACPYNTSGLDGNRNGIPCEDLCN